MLCSLPIRGVTGESELNRLFLITALTLVPVAAGAEGGPGEQPAGPRLDKAAIALAQASAEFLAMQPAMSFDWLVSYDEVIDGREKLTFTRSGTNTLVRDIGFVSRTDRGDALRDYYYDGKVFTVAAPDQNFYASAEFGEGFEALVREVSEKLATPIPLWSLMTASLPDDILEGLDGAAYLGITRIGGKEAHHVAFSDYEEDWQVWISTEPGRPLPLMIVRTEPYQQGWPQYRAYLMNWDLGPPHAAGDFTYVPPEGSIRVSFPSLLGPSPASEAAPAPSGN